MSAACNLDPVGNRLTEASSLTGDSSGSFGYNADDQLSSEAYDQNGNTIATGGKNFTYDAENHLTSMTASGTAVTMIYDAFGNRVAKTVNGVTTRYLVEDDVNPTGFPQVMDELAGNGMVERTYTYGLQRISENQVVNNTWTPSFYGYDGAGSVRQLTNAAGTVTDTYEYDAFGNKVNSTGTTPNNYLYRGEQFDSDIGLYYLRARYYNPSTGRFTSRDPEDGINTDPATLHKYLYADGDPINGRDPMGREALIEYRLLIPVAIASAPLAIPAVKCAIAYAASQMGYQGPASDFGPYAECMSKPRNNNDCTDTEKDVCQKIYILCKGSNCDTCLRNCITQCEWPFEMCRSFRKVRDPGGFPWRIPPGRIQ